MVDPGLVAAALPFEPDKNICVESQRDWLLEDLVVALPVRTQIRKRFSSARCSPQAGDDSCFLRRFLVNHMSLYRDTYKYASTSGAGETLVHTVRSSIYLLGTSSRARCEKSERRPTEVTTKPPLIAV